MPVAGIALMSRVERIGDATVYLGDCREILPTLGVADAVVTDPPYGIDIGSHRRIGNAGSLASRPGIQKRARETWDEEPLSSELWDLVKSAAPLWIVWGGNHLADILGPSAGMLVWDKKCQNGWDDSFSELEIAWTNAISRAKGFRHLWAGALRASEKAANVREHPTQKPIALMEWCLGFLPGAQRVVDPFMGSGTTGVACALTGRAFVGVERERQYFDVACRRIADAYSTPRLFTEAPAAPEQGSIFGDVA